MTAKLGAVIRTAEKRILGAVIRTAEKRIHGRMRALHVLAMIQRRVGENKKVPEEWIEELRGLPDTKERGFVEVEARVRDYNTADLKKVGVRVVRF